MPPTATRSRTRGRAPSAQRGRSATRRPLTLVTRRGRLFTPQVLAPWRGERTGDDRAVMRLDSHDAALFANLPPGYERHVTVTDQQTGRLWRARRARCGLGCFCGATVEPMPRESDQ